MQKNRSYHEIDKNQVNDLLNSAKEGNSSAFSKLSEIVKNISYSYFYSKLSLGKIKNKEDVEDLTNDVYIVFAEQYQDVNNFIHWLRKVLFLSFVNWYKKKRNNPSFELREEIYNKKNDLNEVQEYDIQRVLSLVKNLPEEKQTIIKMRFWEEMRFSEIALKVDKSENAVKKMLYRTIEELSKKIE